MTDLPSMALYVDDFEAATAHLSFEEDGAYNRLLRLCWRQSSCSVPDDDKWIQRHLRCNPETYARVVIPIIEEFFTRSGGRVFQKRQKQEHDRAKNTVEARKEAGKKGGQAKALKNTKTSPSKARNLPEQKSGKPLASIPIPKDSKCSSVKRRSLSTGGTDPPGDNTDTQKISMISGWQMPRDVNDQLEAEFVGELGANEFDFQVKRFIEHHAEAGTVATVAGFCEQLHGWLGKARKPWEGGTSEPVNGNGKPQDAGSKIDDSLEELNAGQLAVFVNNSVTAYRTALEGRRLRQHQELMLKRQASAIARGEGHEFGLDGEIRWDASELVRQVESLIYRAMSAQPQ